MPLIELTFDYRDASAGDRASAGRDVMGESDARRTLENLGAVETLITHPASMTHASIPAELRRRVGISDGLIRLSVGLEDPGDIEADLAQALASAGPRP